MNLKDWFFRQDMLELFEWKYDMQLARWLENHHIWGVRIEPYYLCSRPLYNRQQVMAWVRMRYSIPGLFYKVLEFEKRLATIPAINLDLGEWKPWCLLEETWPWSRAFLYQIAIQEPFPQIRHVLVGREHFYNVADVSRYIERQGKTT